MQWRPTTLERAYELARSGDFAVVAQIKIRLRKEGYDDNQIMGPKLIAELRGLCRLNSARA